METLKIHDKKFGLSISAADISIAIEKLSEAINCDLLDEEVIFIAILNGSFMFAADLFKKIKFNARISFIKLASYEGINSSGNISELIGLNEVIKDKTVVIIEDIVDSGNTLNKIIDQLKIQEPRCIKTVSLLFKPESYEYNYKIDYVGFKIPNQFVVGYGMDYDGLGRNLDSIYTVYES